MSETRREGAGAEGRADAFAFGSEDMAAQGWRNLMVLAALPWTAAFALGAELAAAAFGCRRGG